MTRTRNPAIDVLRGLAVLLVVTHHFNLRVPLAGAPIAAHLPAALVRLFAWTGYYAVIVFFSISGFLITSLSLTRWGPLSRMQPRQFYAMRAARILPCLFALLVILSLLHLSGVREYVIPAKVASLPRALLAALTFHVNWLEGHHGYLAANWDVLWSLSIEEGFYLLFPLLCVWVISPRPFLALLFALIVVGPLSRTWLSDIDVWDDYAWLSCFDGMAFGCLAALASSRFKPRPMVLRALFAVGLAAIILVIWFRKETRALGLTDWGLNVSLLELGASLLLIAASQGVGERWSEKFAGPIRALGRASYEIYLTHMFVIFSVLRFAPAELKTSQWVPAWYAGVVLLSALVGIAVAKFFSEPMNRKLRARLQSKSMPG